MARPEAPVDRTVRARAKLADFLRARRAKAGLTYRQMAELTYGGPSKSTFERAASGATVPTLEIVEEYVLRTMTKEEEFKGGVDAAIDQARRLWTEARRAVRAPYYLHKAPDPALISNLADFSRALRDQHVWAGCPSPGEMSLHASTGMLPKTTAYRIINGRALPVTPDQALAFLKACDVHASEGLEWLAAAGRAFAGSRSHSDWIEAHARLQGEIAKTRDDAPAPILKAVA
ncbi:hypothetical protein [Streptomyces sp. NPDC049744]|uniref:helix-turn-helix domain-containing protein n=1 Tax=Streptomyces sp. NPDC049744 TaxID=3154359 RepID=UPI0034254A46